MAAVLAVAAYGYSTTEALVATARDIERTHRAIEALDQVLVESSIAGSARRLYLLGGEGAEIQKFDVASDEAHDALVRARALSLDTLGRGGRLDRIDGLLRERLEGLHGSIDERRRGLGSESQLPTRAELALVAGLRAEILDAVDELQQSLLAREAETSRSASLAKWTDIVGTALSAVLLAVVFSRLRAENVQRRRSEQELLASQASLAKALDATDGATRFLDSMIENLPAMVFVKDAAELRFERINQSGEKLLGVPRADLLDKNDFDFFPREQAEFFQSKDRETLSRGVVVDVQEEPIETRQGRRWLYTRKVPLLAADGTPQHLLGISMDITERKEAAEQLRLAKEGSEAANRELEAFAYSVAHDLRAPLRSIDGFTRALLEDCGGALPIVGRAHLQRVLDAAHRMALLIDDLLLLSRVTRTAIHLQAVDLSAMAEETAQSLREAEPTRTVEVRIQPTLRTRADPGLLQIVLDNLLGNAFKFTGKRPQATIEFGAAVEGRERVYFVRDDGAGFDSQYATKLFGAFQRLHAERDFPGTGIGLATVQRIVSRHGGRVWAKGEVDRGATFSFTLGEPVADEASPS
jgi:PAS domain S-box-containing protein